MVSRHFRKGSGSRQERAGGMMEFVDGLSEVTILNGIARLEFFTAKQTKDTGDGEGPRYVRTPAVTLALPVEGLLAAMRSLEEVRKRLPSEAGSAPAAAPSRRPSPPSSRPAAPPAISAAASPAQPVAEPPVPVSIPQAEPEAPPIPSANTAEPKRRSPNFRFLD